VQTKCLQLSESVHFMCHKLESLTDLYTLWQAICGNKKLQMAAYLVFLVVTNNTDSSTRRIKIAEQKS